jgi:hypothetical protein
MAYFIFIEGKKDFKIIIFILLIILLFNMKNIEFYFLFEKMNQMNN